MVPSPEAKTMVKRVLQAVTQVDHLAEHAVARERARQVSLGTDKKQVKRADTVRYLLVDQLSSTYADTFKMRPAATRDGSWCFLLAAVLTCCEGKELDNDHAYRIWVHTRQRLDQLVDTLSVPFDYDKDSSMDPNPLR